MSHSLNNIEVEREIFINGKDCEYRHTIQRLSSQSERIDDFMIEVSPLMNYIKAEIKRPNLKEKVAEFLGTGMTTYEDAKKLNGST